MVSIPNKTVRGYLLVDNQIEVLEANGSNSIESDLHEQENGLG